MRTAILAVEGVLSLHELHVWQLSESKIVASVHVMASRKHDFMPVAAKIRKALHLHGIHSSTIQPEYYQARALPEDHLKVGFIRMSHENQYSLLHKQTADETSCLITCPPDQICDPSENACCRESP